MDKTSTDYNHTFYISGLSAVRDYESQEFWVLIFLKKKFTEKALQKYVDCNKKCKSTKDQKKKEKIEKRPGK